MTTDVQEKVHIKDSNSGFSLIELIVTIMVASIVMLAISGLLITSLRAYRMTSNETKLQLEAQAGVNRISELMMEATYFNADYYGVGSLYILTINTVENDIPTEYSVVWDNAVSAECILLAKTGDAEAFGSVTHRNPVDAEYAQYLNELATTIKVNKNRFLLAEYVTNMEMVFQTVTAENSEEELVMEITLDLKKDATEYTTHKYISFRNPL